MISMFAGYLVDVLDRLAPLLMLCGVFLGGYLAGWHSHRGFMAMSAYIVELAEFRRYRRRERTNGQRELHSV